MMNERRTLAEQVKRVAETRKLCANAYNHLQAKRNSFEIEHALEIELVANMKRTLEQEEAELRQLTIEAYQETYSKQPCPGVGIRLVKRVVYDPAEALTWAKTHDLALVLDKAAFEKFARAGMPTPATILEEATATIATDLSAALEVTA